MNPFEMVVLIVAIVMIATVMKTKFQRDAGHEPVDTAETERLKHEVRELKERIHVLERIATDRENSLARQIDELRDR